MTGSKTEHSPMGYGDVDARPDNGDPKDRAPLEDSSGQDQSAAKPPHGVDDGKSGGVKAGSQSTGNFTQDSRGINAMTGGKTGSEDEKSAPGISTDKRSDDTR